MDDKKPNRMYIQNRKQIEFICKKNATNAISIRSLGTAKGDYLLFYKFFSKTKMLKYQ